MKLINLKDEMDKKIYGVNSLLTDIKQLHHESELEMMAVIYKKKNGRIGIGATTGNNAEFVGLLEIAKLQYIDDGFE